MRIDVTVTKSSGAGEVTAVASKSMAHRALICAALSDGETYIACREKSKDILATVECLRALGAEIHSDREGFLVLPPHTLPKGEVTLDCGESGTTYRFLLALSALLGMNAALVGHGRLPARPLSPLYELLQENGVTLSPHGSNPLRVSGSLCGTSFSFPGNVSSQYASGLLLAFPALAQRTGESYSLTLTGRVESLPYLYLTAEVMSAFGARPSIEHHDDGSITFLVRSGRKYRSPKRFTVEGDFSSAAFFLAAGAVGRYPFTVSRLSENSTQGDREIIDLLRRFGAEVSVTPDRITVSPAPLRGITVDASQIPDLVPILAVVATAAVGETRLVNAARLRFKESDRLLTVRRLLESLGGDVTETEDALYIRGNGHLSGGTVSAENDHRIAMSAAIASLISDGPITILGGECADKSYPRFWEDLANNGFGTAFAYPEA